MRQPFCQPQIQVCDRTDQPIAQPASLSPPLEFPGLAFCPLPLSIASRRVWVGLGKNLWQTTQATERDGAACRDRTKPPLASQGQ